MPLIEHCTGLFVVQIRGGLNDCAVLALHIDATKCELSVDWRGLFAQFFNERRITEEILENPERFVARDDNIATNSPHLDSLVHEMCHAPRHGDSYLVKPSLQVHAQNYWEKWDRHEFESGEASARLQRLHNPVLTWIFIAGGTSEQKRLSVHRCRLRRKADREIDLDDEGAIRKARIQREVESNQVAESEHKAERDRVTEVSTKHNPTFIGLISCRHVISAMK